MSQRLKQFGERPPKDDWDAFAGAIARRVQITACRSARASKLVRNMMEVSTIWKELRAN